MGVEGGPGRTKSQSIGYPTPLGNSQSKKHTTPHSGPTRYSGSTFGYLWCQRGVKDTIFGVTGADVGYFRSRWKDIFGVSFGLQLDSPGVLQLEALGVLQLEALGVLQLEALGVLQLEALGVLQVQLQNQLQVKLQYRANSQLLCKST